MCLAVPGQVISTDGAGLERMGRVSFGGIIKQVSLGYLPQAQVGDWVVVHAGFALHTIDEVEAQQVFQYLEEIAALDDQPADADDQNGEGGGK